MSTQTVSIKSLGAQGDGIAHCPHGPVYVPFALPGETVAIAKVKDTGTIISIAEASADRREPACRHFGPEGVNGTCGGCSLKADTTASSIGGSSPSTKRPRSSSATVTR